MGYADPGGKAELLGLLFTKMTRGKSERNLQNRGGCRRRGLKQKVVGGGPREKKEVLKEVPIKKRRINNNKRGGGVGFMCNRDKGGKGEEKKAET